MKIVGLTGGIASGKSTVTAELVSKYKIPVIDCDLISRKVVLPGTPAINEIRKTFGKKVIKDDGSLNRPALGEIIFNDKSQNTKLGKIMGPAIQKQIVWEVVMAFIQGHQICVIDAPTLYETKSLIQFCGEIIVVAVDDEIQLKRLMNRDKSTKEEAMARVKSQLPTKIKINHPSTTEVLYNNGSYRDLQIAVSKMVERLKSRAGILHRVLTLPGILLLLGASIYGYSNL
jgi:dephospho-CoA kinase